MPIPELSGVTTLELVFTPAWFLFGALCGVALVHPELAFRYSNIFQLREVELTMVGVILHVGGAVVALLLVFPYFLLTSPALGWASAIAFYAGAAVFVQRHWPPKYRDDHTSS